MPNRKRLDNHHQAFLAPEDVMSTVMTIGGTTHVPGSLIG